MGYTAKTAQARGDICRLIMKAGSAIQGIIKRIKSKGIEVFVFEIILQKGILSLAGG